MGPTEIWTPGVAGPVAGLEGDSAPQLMQDSPRESLG
jgi:hypothetical protein